jgi:hypothetical protein
MTIKARLDSFERRMRAVAVALSGAGRLQVRIEFVNDPEDAEALAPYRLAPEVLARNETIEIGRLPQAGGEEGTGQLAHKAPTAMAVCGALPPSTTRGSPAA